MPKFKLTIEYTAHEPIYVSDYVEVVKLESKNFSNALIALKTILEVFATEGIITHDYTYLQENPRVGSVKKSV